MRKAKLGVMEEVLRGVRSAALEEVEWQKEEGVPAVWFFILPLLSHGPLRVSMES